MKNKGWLKITLWVIAITTFVFAAVVGVQFVLGWLFVNILPADAFSFPIVTVLFSLIAYILTVLIIVVLPPKIFKKKIQPISRERLGLRGLPTWTDIGLSPIGYVASILLATGLTSLFKLLPWFNPNQAQELGYSQYLFGIDRGIAFVGLAIIAPIFEEIIFRGWLYGKLRIKIPKWLAILLTSLVFGAIHLQWNVGVTVFCMSVVTCILREITGTIYAGMLVHMISNGLAFYLVYVAGMM